MAILEIKKYPNKILKKVSKPIEVFDQSLVELLENMYETMNYSDGVGLAAIQVGVELRALIVNIPREDKIVYKEDLIEIINPEIKKTKGVINFTEGCLSVPDFYEDIERFDEIEIEYQDRFGKSQTLQAQGYLAVAIQHEIDHLNGIVFVDRLPILKQKKFQKELKRIQKEAKRKL